MDFYQLFICIKSARMYVIVGECFHRMDVEVAFRDQGDCVLVLMEVPVLGLLQVPSGQPLGLHQICPGLYSSQGKMWE